MTETLFAPVLSGEICAITSKSEVHRLLICAALADKKTLIECKDTNEDILATADCLRALGAEITYTDGFFEVTPINTVPKKAILPCNESGSTLRFLIPVVCILGTEAEFQMKGRLGERPLSPLKELLEENGAVFTQKDNSLFVKADIKGHFFSIAGNVSSQFISGLLFMLSVSGGEIEITGKTESAPYIDMTVNALRSFGCPVEKTEHGYKITKTHPLHSPEKITAKGDWSNAAFFITAGVVGKKSVTVTGLELDSAQGDKAIINELQKLGAKIVCKNDSVTAFPSELEGADIDASQIPDLVPILSVAASYAEGTTRIYGAGRLRIKESDRLQSVYDMLTSLGGKVKINPDGLEITGIPLSGGEVSSCHDHRIAMSAAVAAILCEKTVTINGSEAVKKSYPEFWKDFNKLSDEKRN